MSLDWVPATTTAVVAIAGYIATWAMAKQQRSAEIAKLQVSHRHEVDVFIRQERREVYPQFLKLYYSAVQAIGHVASKLPNLAELHPDKVGETTKVISDMQTFSYEAMLIADSVVSELANKAVLEVQLAWGEILEAADQGKSISMEVPKRAGRLHPKLVNAMTNELRTTNEARSDVARTCHNPEIREASVS